MRYLDELNQEIKNPDWSVWTGVRTEEIYDNGELIEVVLRCRKFSDYEVDIETLKQARNGLNSTDYISAKVLDSLLSCENITDILRVLTTFKNEYSEVIEKRKKWRDSINELESKTC